MNLPDHPISGEIYGHKEAQKIPPAFATLKAPIGARNMSSGPHNPFCAFSWQTGLGSSRGTVILVALCFVAVLGIMLGGYLALCSRVMSLSNRGFQADLSKQLAEAGIDEALRAFNKNNWDSWSSGSTSVVWDKTTYAADKRAVGTMTFPADKFAQGATAEVKLRVDNYDAHVLGSAWNSTTAYKLNDVVGHSGAWYRCIKPNTGNTPPDLRYWVQAPIPWEWGDDLTYAQYDVVNDGGTWYRLFASNPIGSAPSADTTHWNTIPTTSTWSSGIPYALYDVVYYGGAEYHCTTAHTSGSSFTADAANWSAVPLHAISLSWSNNTTYPRGAVVFHSGVWYYCYLAHISSSNPSSDSAHWVTLTTAPSVNTWSNSVYYFVGDYVYDGGWYRCIAGHTNKSTGNPSYWTSANPYISWAYRSIAYEFNDVVYYSGSGSGTWYRRDVHNTTATWPLPTNTSYWENALSDSWDWASSDSYNIGDVVYLSGSFYRCIRAHSNLTPPNATYWSNEPPFSTYWDEAKSYDPPDVVRYRGSWYLNLQNGNTSRPGTDTTWAIAPRIVEPWSASKTYHVDDIVSASSNWYRSTKDHTNQPVSSTTYWNQIEGPSYVWSASTAYAANSYVSYGRVWYKCITATSANANHSPNNATYWTPTWSQSAGVTTGAPTVYAEATVTLGDGTTSVAQLRATIDPSTLFPNAAGATTTLTISGGTGKVDSYDSELPASADANGDNYVTADAGYSAVLSAGTGSASGTSTLMTIGNGTAVKGYASVTPSSSSPFAPRLSYGSSAIIQGAASSPSPNVDLAQLSRSPYVPQFDIQTPIQQTSIPTSLPNGSTYPLNLGTPGAPTPSVYYYSGSLNIQANEKVNINGPVILRINGYLLCNTGTFNVTSTGSVVVYLPYILRSYASAGGFQNLTKDPKKMVFINTSTTSPSTATYIIAPSSSPEFYGAIYMPNVTATLGLDVRTGNEIFGALSAREITFSGAANLHYDTSLRYATFSGVDQPYTVTDWRELSTAEQATMP